jgi:hypothetical protein
MPPFLKRTQNASVRPEAALQNPSDERARSARKLTLAEGVSRAIAQFPTFGPSPRARGASTPLPVGITVAGHCWTLTVERIIIPSWLRGLGLGHHELFTRAAYEYHRARRSGTVASDGAKHSGHHRTPRTYTDTGDDLESGAIHEIHHIQSINGYRLSRNSGFMLSTT